MCVCNYCFFQSSAALEWESSSSLKTDVHWVGSGSLGGYFPKSASELSSLAVHSAYRFATPFFNLNKLSLSLFFVCFDKLGNTKVLCVKYNYLIFHIIENIVFLEAILPLLLFLVIITIFSYIFSLPSLTNEREKNIQTTF